MYKIKNDLCCTDWLLLYVNVLYICLWKNKISNYSKLYPVSEMHLSLRVRYTLECHLTKFGWVGWKWRNADPGLPYQTQTYSVERSYESEEEHLWCWRVGAVMQPTSRFLQADQLETVMITILILIALLLNSHSHSTLKRSGIFRPDTLSLHMLLFIYILFNCKLYSSFKCSRWWI